MRHFTGGVGKRTLALSLTFSAAIVAAFPSTGFCLSWIVETVDSGGDVGDFPSLKLDSSGNPHISYRDETNGALKYAAWNGASWNTETVDGEGDVGLYTSLALDSSGNPHISYRDETNGALKYAAWNGASWNTETVDSEGISPQSISLALDGAGKPHIGYQSWVEGELKYAAWDGSSWNIETVLSVGRYPIKLSLALDGSDNPHISYREYHHGTLDYLKYAAWDGSAWSVETVDHNQTMGGTSLALDGAGNPHISYRQFSTNKIAYAAWDGSSWNREEVDSGLSLGGYPSLALDASGKPHISYTDGAYMWYATWDGSSWNRENVGVHVSESRLSLAIDDSGSPHIGFYGFPDYNLRYAFVAEPRVPPVADANGPYLAECAGSTTDVNLDGTGSFDPDSDEPLNYSWTTTCPEGSFNDPSSATPILTVGTSGTCSILCGVGLTVTDNDGLTGSDSADVTIQDTTAPEIDCNAPLTIVPPDAPVSFTAASTDKCASSPSVEITRYDCFKYTRKGKRVDKTGSCVIGVEGENITILDSGGVGDQITWTVRASDNCGNVEEKQCQVEVVNPGQN